MDTPREMEEKPEAVVNAVVSKNHISDDLAFSILSKLPPKSLTRFGCVCTSWSHLFENPHFMSMYSINSTHTCLLLKQDLIIKEGDDKGTHSMLFLLSGERFENRVRLDFPVQDYPYTFNVMGSTVNGILSLLYRVRSIVLWNPATSEFKVVPPSPDESEAPNYRHPLPDYKGFGYDHVRDDYKVIRYMKFFIVPCCWPCNLNQRNISFEPFWEIYSLRSDSWKKLDCKMPAESFSGCNGARLYTDGVCHWWGTDGNRRVSCLVSFDLSNEVFFTTPMPSYMGDGNFTLRSMRLHLTVINGSVALISNYVERTTIEISILGKVGVKESWTKLSIVGPLPCAVNIIGMGKKGNIFLRKKNGELAWFDWSTHMIVDLGLKGEKRYCQILTYKENFESLISIGFEKINN